MGKHKKRTRDSSSESSSDEENRKRLRKLERFYKKHKQERARQRSRSRAGRRRGSGSRHHLPSLSPSPARSLLPQQADDASPGRRCRSRSVFSQAAISVARDRSVSPITDGQSTMADLQDQNVLTLENDVELPEEVLCILGDDFENKEKDTVKIHAALASRWSKLVAHGMADTDYNSLAQKYKVPSNFPLLAPPILNPEAKNIIPLNIQKKDNAYVQFQSKLGSGIAALGRGIDSILSCTESMPNFYKESLLPNLSDAGRILSGLFYDLSLARRTFIYPYMNKNTKELVEKCPPTEFLFGSDLSDLVKAAKNIQSTSKDIKSAQHSSTYQVPATPVRYQRPGKKGGGPDRSHPFYVPLNRSRPARRPRETGHQKGRTSRETDLKERYKRRK
nr:unnamed protein product [Callosobruchus analis]